jgi:iron complex outermembrane receptor protein
MSSIRMRRTAAAIIGTLAALNAYNAFARDAQGSNTAGSESVGTDGTDRSKPFDIPAQPLTGALRTFERQSGLRVFFDTAKLTGRPASSLHGNYSSEAALRILLAGANVEYAISESGVSLNTRNDDVTLPSIAVREQTLANARVPGIGKTGTPIGDLPASVSIVSSATIAEQGATYLRQIVDNASGVNEGGQDSLGYFDHFLIRGLNAQVYSDGFSDGDQLGGLSHSLNGVERVEILEGPGSALLGSGPAGGSINIVHYAPSPELHAGASLRMGSFGTVSTSDYVTGPTGVEDLDFRVDGSFSHTDGFRDLRSHDYELRPTVEWKLGDHTLDLSLDARQIRQTPDSYGLIYFNGTPIKGVPEDAKYSTPFAFAKQDLIRPALDDTWVVNDVLTIDNRLSYLHRTLDVMRNGDSTSTKVSDDEVVGRQLRQQDDTDESYDYQFEPVWKFSTGSITHTLLTGFEYQHQRTSTERATADLPNIPDAFAPLPPETSTAGLQFMCDAKHSCDNDRLGADYYSLYATDQIDLGDRLKVRAGLRQDWWGTSLTPLITVPGRFGTGGQPLLANVTESRDDAPLSWNVGALYKLTPEISPYIGVAESHLANFNSENTQNGIGAPESAKQYEAGIKFSMLDDRIVLNTAAFRVSRDNVAAVTTIDSIETVVFDGQRTRGAEASLETRLTDRWQT